MLFFITYNYFKKIYDKILFLHNIHIIYDQLHTTSFAIRILQLTVLPIMCTGCT